MKKLFLSLLTAIMFVGVSASPAFAAKPTDRGGSKPPSDSVSTVGYDVSWPQCGRSLPTDQAFGIVGVNGGLASTFNDCLVEQLQWAKLSSGVVTNQDKVQLYVNTGNPGEVINQIITWPTNNDGSIGYTITNPFGTCDGTNSIACSWQYGWNRAVDDVKYFTPAAVSAGLESSNASDYIWWLDVETMNSWQIGTPDALRRNVATLEAMVSYFKTEIGARVGLYSTAYQWGEITGNYIGISSNLNGLPNWRPSGSNIKNAQKNCGVSPLTAGGRISLTQYVVRNLDNNYSCN